MAEAGFEEKLILFNAVSFWIFFRVVSMDDKEKEAEERTNCVQVDVWKSIKGYFGEKLMKAMKWAFSSDEEIAVQHQEQITNESQNIAFYRNEIASFPWGDKIEDILEIWKGDYNFLEINHFYIQWLFPNRIPGINNQASVLTDEDAKVISGTQQLRDRVRRAFEMMLDFYGMSLSKDNQFQLTENSGERLEELNKLNNHNFACITRILLALKELGHKDLMLPWLRFLANLVYRHKVLNCAASSLENYWVDTLDAMDSIQLKMYIKQLKTDDEKASSMQDMGLNYMHHFNTTHDTVADDFPPINSDLPTTDNTAQLVDI